MTASGATSDRLQPTAAQWAEIETQLQFPYGRVELLCDGHKIVLSVRMMKPLRYTIVVFVDGSWSADRLRMDSEERRKFWRRKTHCTASKKWLDSYRKQFGKKRAEEFEAEITFESWWPDWPSFRTLRRHLLKHCESIAVVKIGHP